MHEDQSSQHTDSLKMEIEISIIVTFCQFYSTCIYMVIGLLYKDQSNQHTDGLKIEIEISIIVTFCQFYSTCIYMVIGLLYKDQSNQHTDGLKIEIEIWIFDYSPLLPVIQYMHLISIPVNWSPVSNC